MVLTEEIKNSLKLLDFDLIAKAVTDTENKNLWMRLLMVQGHLKIDDRQFYYTVGEEALIQNPQLNKLRTKRNMDKFYSDQAQQEDKQEIEKTVGELEKSGQK